MLFRLLHRTILGEFFGTPVEEPRLSQILEWSLDETKTKRSQTRPTLSKVLGVSNKGLQSLASLCRELQEMFRDQPIMLCQTAIAELFKVSQPTVSEWIRALRTLRVLKLAEPAIPSVRAARYYFID